MKLRVVDPLSLAVAIMLVIMLGVQLEQWVEKKREKQQQVQVLSPPETPQEKHDVQNP